MKLIVKKIIRKWLNNYGFQIVPISQHPLSNFMGIDKMDIGMILDIGANAGQFATKIHSILPEALIYSFEPLQNAFDDLQKTFVEKNIKGKTFNFALGDEAGEAEIFLHEEHSPSSSILSTTSHHESLDLRTHLQKKEKIAIRTLDEVYTTEGISSGTGLFIKMDVQGFEDRVIIGGRTVIRKAIAVLAEINLDPLYEKQADFKSISTLLYDLGFRYAGCWDQWQGRDGHVVAADILFLKDR